MTTKISAEFNRIVDQYQQLNDLHGAGIFFFFKSFSFLGKTVFKQKLPIAA